MVATPDLVVLHDVEKCSCCGNSLSEKPEHYDARRVIDIPTIKMYVTEHRRLQRKCNNCGTKNKGEFPNGLVQVAQYGNFLKSLCVYLQNYRMLSFARCRELIADLTGHSISTGSLSNFQVQCSGLLQHYEQRIRTRLLCSLVLHVDETGIRFNGKNSWMHVLSSATISFFAHYLNRGKLAMDEIGLLENYNGTLVHDRLGSYFPYSCDHSLCDVHILRDLNHIEETYGAPWALKIKNILIGAKEHRDKNTEIKASYHTRIFKQYTDTIRPIIKVYDKKFKKTDEQRLVFSIII